MCYLELCKPKLKIELDRILMDFKLQKSKFLFNMGGRLSDKSCQAIESITPRMMGYPYWMCLSRDQAELSVGDTLIWILALSKGMSSKCNGILRAYETGCPFALLQGQNICTFLSYQGTEQQPPHWIKSSQQENQRPSNLNLQINGALK